MIGYLPFFFVELEKIAEQGLVPRVKGLANPRLATPRPASIGKGKTPVNPFSGNLVDPKVLKESPLEARLKKTEKSLTHAPSEQSPAVKASKAFQDRLDRKAPRPLQPD